MKLLSDNIEFLHNMANVLLEEETIDHTQIENLYKYGTITDPNTVEGNGAKSALEAAGIIVPDAIATESEGKSGASNGDTTDANK